MKDSLAGFTALAAIDAAADCLRRNGRAILRAYLPWSTPFLGALLLLLYAADEGDRSLLVAVLPLLVLTGYGRWIGLLASSAAVSAALTGVARPPIRPHLRAYFTARFRFHPVLAGPVALDANAMAKPNDRIRRVRQANRKFFRRVWWCMILFILVVVAQLIAVHYFLFDTILPYLLGLDNRVWREIAFSPVWWAGLSLFLLIGVELFLTVLGSVAYHRLAARWTGADLLQRLEGDTA